MEVLHSFLLVLACISSGTAYSKYGRSCKDIGCRSNEQCVMESDPCSYYQRDNECGSYPTCKRVSSGPSTCATYVCPPTKVCKMDGSTPKCVDDHSKASHVGYQTSGLNDQAAAAPVYPSLPRGETTPRPNARPVNSGGGYQGGQVGSGYPGQAAGGANRNYPQQPNPNQGYPNQGYPNQGYPNQGYPNQGYPNQGYPNQGYPNQGYPNQGNQGYPNQGYNNQGYNNQRNPYGNYNPYQQNPYAQQPPQKSASSSFLDKLTEKLVSYGTNLAKDAVIRKLSGQTTTQ